MRVLVTGSRGQIVTDLTEAGHAAVGFDLLDNQDILDVPALKRSARGCDAIIHSAALLGLEAHSPEDIMTVNLQGTWNVVSAGADAGVRRIVFLSSVDSSSGTLIGSMGRSSTYAICPAHV